MWLIGFWLTLNVNTTFNFIKLQEICEKIYGLFLTIIYMRVTWWKLPLKTYLTEQSKENQKYYFNLIQSKIWFIAYI